MNPEKPRAAVEAITELMRSELESEDRTRFGRVSRLATLAQKIQSRAWRAG